MEDAQALIAPQTCQGRARRDDGRICQQHAARDTRQVPQVEGVVEARRRGRQLLSDEGVQVQHIVHCHPACTCGFRWNRERLAQPIVVAAKFLIDWTSGAVLRGTPDPKLAQEFDGVGHGLLFSKPSPTLGLHLHAGCSWESLGTRMEVIHEASITSDISRKCSKLHIQDGVEDDALRLQAGCRHLIHMEEREEARVDRIASSACWAHGSHCLHIFDCSPAEILPTIIKALQP